MRVDILKNSDIYIVYCEIDKIWFRDDFLKNVKKTSKEMFVHF